MLETFVPRAYSHALGQLLSTIHVFLHAFSIYKATDVFLFIQLGRQIKVCKWRKREGFHFQVEICELLQN